MLRPEMFVSVNQPLDLGEIEEYPVLAEILQCWQRAGGDRPPLKVDPLDLPPKALPYLMLVDLEGSADAVVRLAGTAACGIYGRELKGTSVHSFFGERDAEIVLQDLHAVAASEQPTLTRRSYVSINGKPWSYIRLLLPLRPDGDKVTRVLKALEPSRFSAAVL